ncbi:MAG TPA: TIM-barrel domain-containing protein, partial [Phototrophicaceae bacterium]|nr:TIM-barrel domain-containing protein [Phototrophicaceae bacterium]
MLKKAHLWLVILMTLCAPVSIPVSGAAETGVYRATFGTGDRFLTIEILDDDLAHFEISADAVTTIITTPMVFKTDYAGPSSINTSAPNVIETPEMRLEINPATLCVTVTDLIRDPDLLLTTTCPLPADSKTNGLSLTKEGTTDLYGLGEQFQKRGGTDGNWMGNRRLVLNPYGNALEKYNGGNVENAQFPILYSLGANTDNYALFLDDVYQQYWDFGDDPLTVKTTNPTALRWYIITGANLADLRSDYMELTGRPPVPPKQFFGLWVSEFGYENWDELKGVQESLRSANFPTDGFVMDLQWFGGFGAEGRMGSLAWDTDNFPDPADFIAKLRRDYGLGVMTIEESYVMDNLPDYADLTVQGVLAKECGDAACGPVHFNKWWGKGGMVDWTNPDGAAWWHDNRRQHLIDEGVIGHWTDLGEPENYDEGAWYYGFPDLDLHDHADVHNIYNLLWSKSIWEGYQRHNVTRRPFILSRSGTSGSQRYGVAIWSGDIAANMPSLTAQMNVQMEMSLSGVDYFGSDVGGFNRQVFDPVLGMDGMYTTWLANSALLDIPLRPHASNLQNRYDTAPSLLGDVPSNLANVRLRYALSPYLYTLAHRAYRDGTSIFAPLVYYFQDDPAVRTMGSQKMIGPDLMMATITGYNTDSIQVYLPAGGWFNYYTHEYFESTGETISVPMQVDGVLRAPLFVRDGAIIPEMAVDDQTLNMLGQRADGSIRNDLILNIYSHSVSSGNFTLIEDDGETMSYQDGAVRETPINFTVQNNILNLEVGIATGTYTGAADQRVIEIHVITPDK